MRPSNNLENNTFSDTYILRGSASIYESLDSQFFRTTTEIQSGPHVFDESSFVMNFLTILGVMEISQFHINSRRENR